MGQMNSFGGSLRPTTMHACASDVVLAALAAVSTSFQSVGGAGRGHDVVFRSLGVIAGAPLAARVSCAASATSAACLRANKAATSELKYVSIILALKSATTSFSWFRNLSICATASVSLITIAAIAFGEPVRCDSTAPIFRMLPRPSSATDTNLGSAKVSSRHIGGIQPCSSARVLICSGRAPEVAFAIAHAASLRTLGEPSPYLMLFTSGGMMLASITAWICSLLPAVMLEIVQHASLRRDSFGLDMRASRHGSAEKLMMICV
mmetsp:Transcript_47672/g.132280  ORF Transcript_47672/g.132280 Transcript_47672/m.132280 type:complete len:264 (+) Transcript_47672:362-1153(+)